MENLNIVSIPAIATIVYWVVNLIKYSLNNSETFKRLIPIISALLGGVLGVVCFYIAPDLILAENLLMAVIIGGASGLSATGTNQIIKQMNKGDDKQ